MKSVPRQMIQMYNIRTFDFMGYTFKKESELSYHHLIVPKKENGPITIDNGAILVRDTSHDYLHRIEQVDREVFLLISQQMIEENIKGKLDRENLKRIKDLLLYFEREYSGATLKNGQPLIKSKYITRRI